MFGSAELLPASFHSLPFCCLLWREEAFYAVFSKGKTSFALNLGEFLSHSIFLWYCVFLYIGSHSDGADLGTEFCVIFFIQLFNFYSIVSFYNPLPWFKKTISVAFCFPNDFPQPSLILSKPVQLWIVSWQCLSHYFNLWEFFYICMC